MDSRLNSVPSVYLSNLMEFKLLPRFIFDEVKALMEKLGMPVTVNEEKQEISFLLSNMEARLFDEHFSRKMYGILSSYTAYSNEDKCYYHKIGAIHYEQFKLIAHEDLPRYSAFESKLPSRTVTEHPAFIGDEYTQIHTEILKRQPLGTYAIIKEAENLFLLLVVVPDDKKTKVAGFQFQTKPDGSIEDRNGLPYQSINHLLNDDQMYYHSREQHSSTEQYLLTSVLSAKISADPLLTQEVQNYQQNLKNPKLIKIVEFLREMATSGLLSCEQNEVIHEAISSLKLNFSDKDIILSALIKSLSLRKHIPLTITQTGNSSGLHQHHFFNAQVESAKSQVNMPNHSEQLAKFMEDSGQSLRGSK